jgi:hypothetical protein
VTTILAARPAIRSSLSLGQAFTRYQSRLLAYITTRLPVLDWHTAEDVAQDIWLEALTTGPRPDHADQADEGLPGWLAWAARTVIRRRVSPVPAGDADWELLTQMLGHSISWPEHWHDVLVTEGQSALLKLAAVELEQPAPARVDRQPSAVRTLAAVAA